MNEDIKASRHSANDEVERIKQDLLDTRESQLKSFEEQKRRFEELQERVKEAMDEQSKRQEELRKQYSEMVENKGKHGDDNELEEARKTLDEKQQDIINDFKKHKELLEQLLQQQKANLEGDETGKHSDKDKKTKPKGK